MQLPKEFFTLQSMLTLSGATGATFIVSNGCQKAFNFNPKWLALAVSVTISLMGVYQSGGQGSDYFVGVINGFLIFCTTAGATTVAGIPQAENQISRGAADARLPNLPATTKRDFLTSWF